jgi:RNA polymerase sigma-70 factor (ECF subfamily)
MMRMVEQQLIEGLLSKDRSAFDVLFRSYYSTLVRIASDILHDRQAAEDVVQDTFVKLWETGSGLTINSSLSAYLVKMVRNRCIDSLRAAAREPGTVSIDLPEVQAQLHEMGMEADFEDELFATPLEIALTRAIEQLPPQCKRIFTLNRFDGYSHKEIADELHISASTVKTQITRALQKLTAIYQTFQKKRIDHD